MRLLFSKVLLSATLASITTFHGVRASKSDNDFDLLKDDQGYWDRFLQQGSDASFNLTLPPTKIPVETPAPTPEPAGPCDIGVNIDCSIADGTPCDGLTAPNAQCPTPSNVLTFEYTSTSCLNNSTIVQGVPSCENFSPLDPSETVDIQCVGARSQRRLRVEPSTVSSFGTFTVTTRSSADLLPALISCDILDSSGNVLQTNAIETVDMALGNEYGAFKLVGCDDITCFETLLYNIDLVNQGETDADIISLNFILNGEALDILGYLSENSLTPGNATGVQIQVEAPICDADRFVAVAAVEATPPSGQICRDRDQYAFVAPEVEGPLTPAPSPQQTPQPSFDPTPAPVPDETPAPNATTAPVTVPTATTVPAPTIPVPTATTVPAPTIPTPRPPVPPTSGLCILELSSQCTVRTNSTIDPGQPCEESVQFVAACTDRPTSATMLLTGGDCSTSAMGQPSTFFCNDQGQISTARGTPYFIVVTDAANDGVTYFSGVVNVGDTYTLQNGQPFADDQIIRIFTADRRTLLQNVQYGSSCGDNLVLLNRFGANQLVEFTNQQQGLVSSFETFSFAITISVPDVPGSRPVLITSLTADTNIDGVVDLTEQVRGNPILPGQSLIATLVGEVELTTSRTYEIRFNVEGKDALENLCVGQESVSFQAGGLPPVPGQPAPSAPIRSPTLPPSKKGETPAPSRKTPAPSQKETEGPSVKTTAPSQKETSAPSQRGNGDRKGRPRKYY